VELKFPGDKRVYGITWFIIQRDQGGGGDGNFPGASKVLDNLQGVMRGYQFTYR
jgi:hypothetical protein